MISEERLAELQKRVSVGLGGKELKRLLDTLQAAYVVVRAAKKVDASAQRNGDESNEVLELRESLAPFEGRKA